MRTAIRALGLTLSVLGSSVAFEALAVQTAYFNVGTAYLVDTNSKTKTAQIASNLGASSGPYVDSGNQRSISLTTPFGYEVYGAWVVCPGQTSDVLQTWRRDVQTLVLKRLSGSAKKGQTAVIEAGTDTEIAGCNVGKVTPFGSPDDTGLTLSHLALTERPSMADVKPGTRWAGLHEGTYTPQQNFSVALMADIVTAQADGRVRFEQSGRIVDSVITTDDWWTLSLPSGDRAYTRLSRDKTTGAEVWLLGDKSNGRLSWAAAWWVLPMKPGKGFGDVIAASRSWENGLSNGEFFRNMYSDFSEDIYQFNPYAGGWERQLGWNWRFDGANIIHTRVGSWYVRNRIWEPVRRVGPYQWVMDGHQWTDPNTGEPLFPFTRQVFLHIDTGPAIQPTGGRASSRTSGAIDLEKHGLERHYRQFLNSKRHLPAR
ncbi:hypothetical protein [Ideonella sp.]|jgi:hypothetical protein|uniref:hypothetical protein n=1 Tax=Ideonella sp. TaxID=1929293 RepID=UPI0037C0079B